ncbi:hypothetical protein [uncultured Tenacibaculum sp.]|uniref:hypothetical protein n=1 Tax=uncultured Tenacibaculum sp. TaxID=174713 RepID=UPI002601AAFA|nr:hypothetical protein [uncultured Tenacibaculum sp.]
MRILILFFTCTLLFSCLQEKKIKKPTWLFGKWKRIYNEAKKRTYEFWENDFSGIGFSLQKNDTVFKEVLHHY